MKRLLAVMLTIVLVLPSSFAEADDADVNNYIGEYESFDDGSFEVVNGANSSEKLLKKDTVTKWVFKKENNTGYNMANYPENFIQNGDGINTTAFLSTGNTTMIDGKKSRTYSNFERVYNQGTVTHEIRLKKPANGVMRYYLCDSPFSGYNLVSGGQRISQIVIRSNGTVTYADEWTSASSRTSTSAGITLTTENSWIHLRFVINMPTRTIKLSYGESLDNMKPWTENKSVFNFMACGSSGSYFMAEPKFASVAFLADTQSEAYQLACDDVKVYYGNGSIPIAYDVELSGHNIAGHDMSAEYKYFGDSGEKSSVIEWCVADDKYLTENVAVLKTETINADIKSNYTLADSVVGKYIGVRITPSNAEGVTGNPSVTVFKETVREPVTTPTVTMITPYSDTRILQNYPVYLSADAFCDNTQIAKVEFYSDDMKIAESTTAPYFVKYNDFAIGNHSVYAIAYNALGESTKSDSVSFETLSVVLVDDEFDLLREKRKEQLTGGTLYNPLDEVYAKRIAQIDTAAENSYNKISSNASYSTNTGYLEHVKNIALAYATNGSKYQGNKVMGDLAVEAFTKLGQDAYSVNSTKGFYWGWEFGSPTTICNTIALMYEIIPQEVIDGYMAAIDKHNPDIGFTAANKMWDCQAILLRGVMGKNADKINQAITGMKPVYKYVTSGDGYYEDGSFIQHSNIAYNGGYGKSLMRELSESVAMLEGTSYEITDVNLNNIYEITMNAYVPYIYRGEMMDMVRGREIGSPVSRNSHRIGNQAIHFIIRMTQFAPESYNTEFKGIIKKWIAEDKYDSLFESDLPLDIIRLAKEINDDVTIEPADELIKSIVSANMARAVHLRNGWALGISMSSKRVGNYEANDGNGTAWYTGSGMTYLYTDDMKQFTDHYWTTNNRYRLPGTTIDTVGRSNGEGLAAYNAYSWVGGSTLNDLYSAAGMHLSQYNTTLQAKKSWFMFDDEVVCVGSGISSTDDRIIESIVESRKLNENGTNKVYIDGQLDERAIGEQKSISPDWINIQGNVENADVGYYFPEGSNINVMRELRDGTNYGLYEIPWDYNYKEARYYMTIWYDHGKNPDGAGYSYVLLPKYSADKTAEYNEAPDVEIIAKTDSIHAVKEKDLGITAINFWDNGGTVEDITCNSAASVMVMNKDGKLDISASDPNMNQSEIELTVDIPVSDSVLVDEGITVVSADENGVKLKINVNKAMGKTFSASFTTEEKEESKFFIYGYYNKSSNTLVDIAVGETDFDYTAPHVENPELYEVRKFVWASADSMVPVNN